MTLYLAIGLLFVVVAVAFVLLPILRPSGQPAALDSQRTELEAQRRELYRQILEIEFDQQVGKIDPADARALCDALLAQAARLLASESVERGADEVEQEIEREVAALRQALRLSGETVAEMGVAKP